MQRLFSKNTRSSFKLQFRRFSTDSFMNGNSTLYIEQMYQKWTQDKSSVHASWDAYFSNIAKGADPSDAFQSVPQRPIKVSEITAVPGADPNYSNVLRLFLLVRSFRNRGHAIADLDPLSTL